MNRPINEYFINCAKNIYQVNFDLLSMTKIAGLNFRHNDRHFPLLYALGRGARYIEIEIWVTAQQNKKNCRKFDIFLFIILGWRKWTSNYLWTDNEFEDINLWIFRVIDFLSLCCQSLPFISKSCLPLLY